MRIRGGIPVLPAQLGRIYKTADEIRNNAGIADDAHLSWSLAAGVLYQVRIEGVVQFAGAEGLAIGNSFSGAITFALWEAIVHQNAVTRGSGRTGIVATDSLTGFAAGSALLSVVMTIQPSAPGILRFRWGQNVVTAADTTLFRGTHGTILPLNT